MKESKITSPNNIRGAGNVTLPPDEVALADALALDDKTVCALVELIFSQKDESTPPS